ncbi:hypothetical protein BGY98DRAFT_999749 [Russula aff. rugulosa BPL654]|nr:hypothetical protein BGY98DRAFT_999749 [Russula aff. rugulosa BPL654]
MQARQTPHTHPPGSNLHTCKAPKQEAGIIPIGYIRPIGQNERGKKIGSPRGQICRWSPTELLPTLPRPTATLAALPIKPNPLPPSLSPIIPSRALARLPLHILPFFLFSSHPTLCIIILSSPSTLSVHLSLHRYHHARRVQTYPKGLRSLPSRRAPQSLQLPILAAPSQEPRACRGLQLVNVRAACRRE